MNRLIPTVLAPLALTVAGCGDDGAEQPRSMNIKTANPGSDKLKTLSKQSRHLGLYRAIRDSGQKCKKVVAGVHQQDYKNMAMWTARCSDTGGFAVFIAPNGDIQVRQCRQMEQLGLPECRIPDAPADQA